LLGVIDVEFLTGHTISSYTNRAESPLSCGIVKKELGELCMTYLTPKAKKVKSRITGFGVVAVESIRKGELITDAFCVGAELVSKQEAMILISSGLPYELQIDDDAFLVARSRAEVSDGDFINHSCNPNCGIKGKSQIVAIRDVRPGEELAYDYAMSDDYDYRWKCQCGEENCRGVITGNDWKSKKLQEKYKGFFSEYLQKKIDKSLRNLR